MASEIILEAGTEFVPADEIPSLIANALYPNVRKPRTVANFVKHARSSANAETMSRGGPSIDEDDRRELDEIWKDLPPLPEHATENTIGPYMAEFRASSGHLGWDLGICWNDPMLIDRMLRRQSEDEHRQTMLEAIRNGDLVALSGAARVRLKEYRSDAIVPVEDLRRYLSRSAIVVVIPPRFTLAAQPKAIDPALEALDPKTIVESFENFAGMQTVARCRASALVAAERERIRRQVAGFFTPREAAQVLAETQGIAARSMLNRIFDECVSGGLPVRDLETQAPRTTGVRASTGRVKPMLSDLLLVADVNAMLARWGVAYRFPEARAVPAGEEAARRSEPPETGSRHQTFKDRRNVLDPIIEQLTTEAGSNDVAVCWPRLWALAERDDRPPPLIGVADGEIKYTADNGFVTGLSRDALSKRLKRRAGR